MNIMVFAGPSLSGHDWSEEPGLIHLPPARAGDVYRAVRRGANAIGLIDGVFELCPAVRHKEILWALSQGVHMYGAASIGALRAAECERYGMRGVGDVFAQYAAGDLVDDDEVALTHAPAAVDYQPLSEAMVNIRATLRAARADSVVDDGLCDALLDTAKKAYFKRRTWATAVGGTRLEVLRGRRDAKRVVVATSSRLQARGCVGTAGRTSPVREWPATSIRSAISVSRRRALGMVTQDLRGGRGCHRRGGYAGSRRAETESRAIPELRPRCLGQRWQSGAVSPIWAHGRRAVPTRR